mmetsp:Transcript_52610/g.148189  ORF Transcript_52610/g.148189 Transcript_52610/m.148189 type:complete len:234 (-) Transcript_52610:854-1555(-)
MGLQGPGRAELAALPGHARGDPRRQRAGQGLHEILRGPREPGAAVVRGAPGPGQDLPREHGGGPLVQGGRGALQDGADEVQGPAQRLLLHAEASVQRRGDGAQLRRLRGADLRAPEAAAAQDQQDAADGGRAPGPLVQRPVPGGVPAAVGGLPAPEVRPVPGLLPGPVGPPPRQGRLLRDRERQRRPARGDLGARRVPAGRPRRVPRGREEAVGGPAAQGRAETRCRRRRRRR